MSKSNFKTKIISLLLVMALVITMVPMNAFATEIDTTGPVITVVSCDKENGILYEGDSITLMFSLEDESGIGSNIGMLMTYTDPSGENYREFIGPSCIYNSDTGLYECTFTVNSTDKVGTYKFAKLHAYDAIGNYSYIRPGISFVVKGMEADTTGPVITVASCDKENEILYESDSITLMFSLEDESGIGSNIGMLMTYTDPSGENYREFIGPSCIYNSDTGLYECTFTVNSADKVGTYKFAKLHAYDAIGNYSYIRLGISFVVKGTETDTTGPVITEISCNKQEETLLEGDSITYTFSLEDESGIGSNIGMLMTYTDPNGENYREFTGPSCIYNSDTGLYECTFTVNATDKVGKYEFAKLHAYDSIGNYSSIRPDKNFYVGIADINDFVINEIEDQEYTGETITPSIDVYYEGVLLDEGVYYNLYYGDNTSLGTGTITVIKTKYSVGEERLVDFNIIHSTNHSFDLEWTVDKEATCTEDGSKSRHCSICDVTTDAL